MAHVSEIFAVLLFSASEVAAQSGASAPRIVDQGTFSRTFSARRTIEPNAVHRYHLPDGGPLFLHVLVNQISADVAVEVELGDGALPFRVDATDIGWESVPVLLPGGTRGKFDISLRVPSGQGGTYDIEVREYRSPLSGDEHHVQASASATQARQFVSAITQTALEGAIVTYEEVLGAWQRSNDRFGQLMTLLALANLSYRLSEFQKGEDYSARALGIARSLADHYQEGSALNNLAMCEIPLGLIESARDHMMAAAESFRNSGSLFAVAAAHINLGLLEYQTGHWSDSLQEYGEARTLAQEQLRDQRLEGYALNNIAYAYIAMGERDSASAFLERARIAFDRTGERQASARAKSMLGRIRFESGHVEEARRAIGEAIIVLHILPDRRAEGDALNYLGQVVEKVSPREARTHYHDSLKVFREAGSILGESTALYNLGHMLGNSSASTEREEGISLLRQSAEMRHQIGVYDLEAESLFALAVIERASNDLAAAVDHVRNAIRITELARGEAPGEWLRSAFIAKHSEMYEFAVDLFMQMYRSNPRAGYDRGAFEMHERGLARALIERLSVTRGEIVKGVDSTLLQKSRKSEDLINLRSNELLQIYDHTHKPNEEQIARTRLESALAEYRLVEAQIRASSRAYRNLSESVPFSIERVQRMLAGQHSRLIEFALCEPRSYLWAVDDSDFRSYELPGRSRMERLASGFLSELGVRVSDGATASATPASIALGDLLKGPLSNPGGRIKLLLVTEGGLTRIPFAAIRLQRPTGQEPQYLIESWETSLLPSALAGLSLLQRSSERKPATHELAVFADAVYSPDDERIAGTRAGVEIPIRYPRLAFTRQEADVILSLKPSPSNLKALDFDASVATAVGRLNTYRMIHFSVHSYTEDAEHPESSGLVLSLVNTAGEKQDGILRVPAILKMDLRADLVVLSACHTAAGKEIRMEGIFGLTQAFMYAGAQRVVSSLWPVDEFSTRLLMTRFYEGVLLRGLKPAPALRAAQLSMARRKASAAPSTWSAFVLYGM